jgi:hypothetical protein
VAWADARGVLDEVRRGASGSGDRTDVVEATQGGATDVDVTKSPADGALDDIAWRASDMAVGEHVLHRVRDGVYHRVHGR